MKEQLRNLAQPENLRLLPLAMLGLAKGLGAMVIHELGRSSAELKERQAASITYYSSFEERPETREEDTQIQ